MSLENRNRRNPTSYIDFVKKVASKETVLPERPSGPIPEFRKKGKDGVLLDAYEMDGYGSYSREPPLARSPTERTSWAARDEGFRGVKSERDDGFRGMKNERDRESFYRGRSPGMSHSINDIRILSPSLSFSESCIAREACSCDVGFFFPSASLCDAPA